MSKCSEYLIYSDSIFTSLSDEPISGYITLSDGIINKVCQSGIDKDSIESFLKELTDQGEIDSSTAILDMRGHTVTPSFTDVHCFFSGYSVNTYGADLSACNGLDDIVDTMKNSGYCAPSGCLYGHGVPADITFPEGHSTDNLLDTYFPDTPVIVFKEGAEEAWLNGTAKKIYQFDTGACWPERYYNIFKDILSDQNYIIPKFMDYMAMMNSRGITAIKEMGFDDYYGFTKILDHLKSDDAFTLDMSFMSQPVGAPCNIDYGKEMAERFNDYPVRFSGYNQMTDGSVSELCADIKKPYNCKPDSCCEQDINWAQLEKDVLSADASGFRFSLHAQGDAAIEKSIGIFSKCQLTASGQLKNRHCITDLEFSDPLDLEKMGSLGVIAEIYPQIQSIANRKDKLAMIDEKIGSERGKNYWNRRKMVDSGVVLSCGTDLPLLYDNIPESIYHAVGGYFPEGGEPFNKENMITIPELLKAWTLGGAYNLGSEKISGTLEAGKRADIVIFDGDLFNTPIEQIRNLSVQTTFHKGRKVFSK